MDVLEFDAASNTQVDKIRDIILDGINIGTARDRFKVFIIDEVHMLSNSSFNALLKTVEEPPPNVVFIMATTELQKVPDTITSRSQEFIFRIIPQAQIFDRLRLIADAEKIDIDDAALKVIARSGEGSMRDAQSNFDQVISFSGDRITVEEISNALGLAGGEMIERVVTSIATGEAKTALEVVADLVDRGQDLRSFCRDILAVLRDILMLKVSGGDIGLVESSVLNAEDLARQAERFTQGDLIRSFHALAETEAKLKDAVQSRYVLEVGLVKLIELRHVAQVEDLLQRLSQFERRVGDSSAAIAPSAAAASAVSVEKKTLKSEPPAPTVSETSAVVEPECPEPDLGIGYRDLSDEPETIPEPEPASPPPTAFSDLSFLNSLPVKLPPIASDDLAHFEDKVLDPLYERALMWSGEKIGTIPGAAKIVRELIGDRPEVAIAAHANGTGAAPARIPVSIQIPDFVAIEESGEVPQLSDDPSERELLEFAEAHRSVQRVRRIFRAKVTRVSKITEPVK
jgi:DNA polymerase-3 subunit gamma/tau